MKKYRNCTFFTTINADKFSNVSFKKMFFEQLLLVEITTLLCDVNFQNYLFCLV